MLKSQLIERLASKQSDRTVLEVTNQVNIILKSLAEAIKQGQRIELRGFGSFSLHYHPPRTAHNPKTLAQLTTPGKHSAHFKPGKKLRALVDSGKAG